MREQCPVCDTPMFSFAAGLWTPELGTTEIICGNCRQWLESTMRYLLARTSKALRWAIV